MHFFNNAPLRPHPLLLKHWSRIPAVILGHVKFKSAVSVEWGYVGPGLGIILIIFPVADLYPVDITILRSCTKYQAKSKRIFRCAQAGYRRRSFGVLVEIICREWFDAPYSSTAHMFMRAVFSKISAMSS
jgi:hypothetical protein